MQNYSSQNLYPFRNYLNDSHNDLTSQPSISNSIGSSGYRNYAESTNSVNSFSSARVLPVNNNDIGSVDNINNIHNNVTCTPPFTNEPYVGAQQTTGNSIETLNQVDDLNFFLATAPANWQKDQIIRRYLLPNGEYVSCVLWNNIFYMTGTDIVRTLVFRFESFGRRVTNPKKFEEGVFSDLRNLKAGQDAILESPKSPFLELLFKNNCVRTQKKQKVFYWYSVPHDRLFLDAFERDLKRERANQEPTTVAEREPAISFQYDPLFTLSEQLKQATYNGNYTSHISNNHCNHNNNEKILGDNYINYNNNQNNHDNLYNESSLTFDLLKINSPSTSPISSPISMDNLSLIEANKNTPTINVESHQNENVNFYENDYNLSGYSLGTTKELDNIDIDFNHHIDFSQRMNTEMNIDANISNITPNIDNIKDGEYNSNFNVNYDTSINMKNNVNINGDENINRNINEINKFNTNENDNDKINSNHSFNNMNKIQVSANNHTKNINHSNKYLHPLCNKNHSHLYANERPYHSSPSLPLSPFINPQELSSSPLLDSSSDIFRDKLDGFSSLTDLDLHDWISDDFNNYYDYSFEVELQSQSQSNFFTNEFN